MRAIWVLILTVAFAASADVALAQTSPVRRFTVRGKVTDQKGRPIASGMVYLKETRSHLLKIKPTDRDGQFAFTLLDTRFDYEIYAERADLVSEKVLVARNQEKPEVVINLILGGKAR